MPIAAANVDHHVRHRNVTGGWLRPALFGATDGLVSNFALVAGVAGGDARPRVVLLAGLAGMLAGASSMGAGEYNSVRSQGELALAEIELERRELARAPEAEEAELAGIYRSKGLTHALSREVAKQLSADPEVALQVHTREELGIDPNNLPSPWVAAFASFVAFGAGALVPLLPYLFGMTSSALRVAAVASGAALVGVGLYVGQLTSKRPVYVAMRQLALGGGAALLTYLVGTAVGVGV